MHTKVCRKCDQSLQPNCDRCTHCGHSRIQVQRCVCCGAEVQKAMVRCRECGAAIGFGTKTVSHLTAHEHEQKQFIRDGADNTVQNTPKKCQAEKVAACHDQLPSSATTGNSNSNLRVSPKPKIPNSFFAGKSVKTRRAVNWRAVSIVGGSLAGLMLAVFVTTQLSGTEPTTQAAGNSFQVDSATERSAAVWVVQHFGVVTVRTEDGKTSRYVAAEHLPSEPFVVTEINLYGQEFDERELSFLPRLSNLIKVDFSKTDITDRGLAYVGRISGLKSLGLRGNKLSPDSYGLLRNGSHIETCSVSGSSAFDDAALASLSEAVPNLRTLSCGGTSVSPEGLQALMTMNSLKQLIATKNKLPDDVATKLRAALPGCTVTI